MVLVCLCCIFLCYLSSTLRFSAPPPILLLACTCTPGCCWASSGPSLWTGDDTVSGSLLSQPKCHSGGLTFPVADARAGGLRAGCHPCGSTHTTSILQTDLFFALPNSPCFSVVFATSFLFVTIHVKRIMDKLNLTSKVAAVKYSRCMLSRLNSGASPAPKTATDTWCIRSPWKELQICVLDLFEGVSYTASTTVFTNESLALNGKPQLARTPVNTFPSSFPFSSIPSSSSAKPAAHPSSHPSE